MKHLLKNILAPIVALFVAFVAMPQAAQAQTNEAYVVENGSTLTFYYDANKATRTGTVYGIKDKRTDNLNMPAWAGTDADIKENITKVVFDNSFRNYKPTSMKYWFYNYTKINAIEGLSNLQTGKVTSMGYMFINCSSLTSLDLSSFNTKNVVNMASMFYSCSSLSSLDLSSFNTSKVTDMAYMFRGCSAIKMLNVSSFNTENVTDMRFLFNNCANLTTIYCNDDWNTSTVQYCDSMFSGCTSLVGAVAYDASKTDVTMANPTTGYFTKKDGGVESLESEAVPAARRGIYNLQGIKMQGSFDQLPAGFYIVNGQKVFKK